MKFEAVIGLEVHAQLLTQSKLFCGCSTSFGAAPNTHTCEVCLGLPGALPVLNAQAVQLALRAALGLGCQVHPRSQWSRKNYFYPDLSKGYQISQYDQPLATGGSLLVAQGETTQRVGITRIHMEEDAGKSVHDDLIAGQRSYVDFNRSGTALIEIVGEPDLRSSAAASVYLKTLRQILRYLNVCDGNMEEGSLRCDANISIRPVGESRLGTRVELKNINSVKFVQQALDHEIARQTEWVLQGKRVLPETRLWDTQAKATRAMRFKEEAHDYRYFPEPDLPDLRISADDIDQTRRALPELPAAKLERYTTVLGLTPYDAKILVEDANVASFFEEAIGVSPQPNCKAVANWMINILLHELKDQSLHTLPLTGQKLGALVGMLDEGLISRKIAKDIFAELLSHGGDPREIMERHGWVQLTDAEDVIAQAAEEICKIHANVVTKYRAGKTHALGFLVGQVLQKTGGKADPKQVYAFLQKKLSA